MVTSVLGVIGVNAANFVVMIHKTEHEHALIHRQRKVEGNALAIIMKHKAVTLLHVPVSSVSSVIGRIDVIFCVFDNMQQRKWSVNIQTFRHDLRNARLRLAFSFW